MSFSNLIIKDEYRSLIDNVISDFYIPVLKESILYQRAVGFFSSSALIAISKGIEELINNGGRVQVIASPRLLQEDIDEIKKGYEVRKVIERALLRGIESTSSSEEVDKLSFIASLIAEGFLDIKIAFVSSKNSIAMYHEKMGIMTDAEGNSIAFSGSMNESENAFTSNYESFDVFCSWTNDSSRVIQKQTAFKALWENFEPGIETITFPEVVKEKLYSYNAELSKTVNKDDMVESVEENLDEMYLPSDFHIRQYQKNAILNWINNGYCGIFDMATGTGKTLTALASVEQLFRDNGKRLGIVIVCPYQHLVEQWVEDITRFGIKPIIGYSQSPQSNWKKRFSESVCSFNLRVSDLFCFITTNDSFVTKDIQDQIRLLSNDVIFIADEAHNMGATVYRKFLPESIRYRLALSATLDRHNDCEGTSVLLNYFGSKCITYSLKEAIENKMLTPYYYYPVQTYLNQTELLDYLKITSQIVNNTRKEEGRIVSSDPERVKRLLIRRARLVAGSKGKIAKLQEKMLQYAKDKHILVYCGATTVSDEDDIDFGKRQIEVVADLLGNTLNMRVGRFTSQETAKERTQIKEAFAEGDMLQALVAIKCLDEGVNIPSIKTAFILASSTNPKEYIQRRGRVLRKFHDKEYSEIYDFITLPFPPDSISQYSEETVKATKGLVRREIIRLIDFAEIAENPSVSNKMICDLKHLFKISEEEILNEEGDNYVIR